MSDENEAVGADSAALIGTDRRRTRLVELMRGELDFSDIAIKRNAATVLPDLGKTPVDQIVLAPDQRITIVGKLRDEIDFTEEAIIRFAKVRVQIDTDY